MYNVREKPIQWLGRSLEDVRAFPTDARAEAGHDLFLVQQGEPPRDWKPMASVGHGAVEIRVRTRSGGRLEHRIVYVAKFPDTLYVLHAFQKTTRSTSRQGVRTARERYREMLRLREKGS